MSATTSAAASAVLNEPLPRDVPPADLLEQVADGVLITDDAGRIVYAEPSAARALLQPTGELHGQSGTALRRWMCPDQSGRPGAAGPLLFARALQGERVEAEYRGTTSDSQTWWIRWSEAPLRDAAGSIQGAVAWVQEVTRYQQRTIKFASTPPNPRSSPPGTRPGLSVPCPISFPTL
jgi:PAS domain-containing protein